MGNSCCHAESPCSSTEERSGLLKNDSKVSIPVSETIVVGTCGPEGDDDIRKTPNEANVTVEGNAEDVQVKQSSENGEVEPRNTQENGLLEKEGTQTSAPSPARHAEENSTTVSFGDVKEPPADLLHCTSNSPQKENHTWEVFPATNATTSEENPASAEERIQDAVSQAAEAKTPPDREVNPTLDSSHSEDESAKVSANDTPADPSVQQKVSSVPNAQLSAAEHQASSISALCQEISSSSSCVAAQVPENESLSVLKDADLHSSGSESTGLDHSGEEREPTDALREPATTAPADASESQVSTPEEKLSPAGSDATSLSKSAVQDAEEKFLLDTLNKAGDVPEAGESGEVENSPRAAVSQAGGVVDVQESAGGELQASEGSSSEVREREDATQGALGNSEEDLYRAAEELSAPQSSEPGPRPALETTLLKLEDRCSLAPAVDILSYSEREWRGNTAKSALIRKGYREMSLRFGSVRRVRGDNYCALRATLFQVLSHSTQLPAWLQEEDVTMLPKHLEAQQGLTTHWTFPRECYQGEGTGDAVQQLQGYMELLQNKWRAAVDCPSAAERQRLCERVFQGGEEELGLLEALKLLMLGRAVELHGLMAAGADVPLFCWLLFARDSSDCPRSFLANHLSHVGLSAGLEQVEMFLLGDALQCTIQVYRLYKADTEEFVTYYPDDHKDDWPCVCLVTEDDRHYNVPVVEAASVHRELLSS